MKKLFFIAIVFLVIACSKEESEPALTDSNIELRLETTDVISDLQHAPEAQKSSNSTPPYDCGENYLLDPITNKTNWDIFSNPSGYLDYHLEESFNLSSLFNLRRWKKSPPIFVNSGTIEFSDSPAGYDLFTGEPYYDYLSDTIYPTVSNAIMQELACEMQEFVDQNNPGYYIYDVDVFGDLLLCGGPCVTRFVRVNFKIGY